MANVDIAVGDKSYNVDIDGLEQMSPPQQQAAYASALKQLQGSAAAPAPTHSQAAPAPAPAAPQPQQDDESFAGAAMHGLHNAAQGFGATLDVAGKATGSQTVQDAGKAVAGAIGDAPRYKPTDIAGSLRQGDLGGAVRQLPRAAVEAGTDLAGALGAGAVGSVLGPVGTAAGVAAYTGARSFGENAQAAAAANHNAPEDNLGRAGLVTAGQAALNTIGLGKLPGVGRAVESIPSAVGRSAARVGLDAVGGAAQDAAGQIGNTVGTTDGAKFDPYQSASAGLQAGAARGAGETASLGRAVVKTGVDRAMEATVEKPATVDHAQSILRVRDDYQAAMERAKSTKGDTSPLSVMNTVKTEYAQTAIETVRAMRDRGMITPEQARNAQAAFEQARRHNNTITEGDGVGPATLFDRITEMPIGAEAHGILQNLARDMDTAAGESFARNQTGPFQQIGKFVGSAGSLVGAALSHDPYAMVGAALGKGIAGKLGGVVGSGLDRVFDTSTPQLLLKARAAERMTRKAGVEAGDSSLEGAQSLRAAVDEIGPAVQKAKTKKAIEEINAKIRGDFEDTAERDAQSQTKEREQADAKRQRDLDAMQKQASDTEAARQGNIRASTDAQERVQAQIDKTRTGQVENYLAGAGSESGVAPVSAQTRAEIAQWTQTLRNRAAADRDANRAQKVLSKSEDGAQSAAVLKARQLTAMQRLMQKQTVSRDRSADRAEAQRGDPTDAYMKGKLDDPSIAPGDWEAEYRSFTSDQAAQGKEQTRVRKVADKATAGTLDALAQSRADKAGKANEVQLRAAGMTPSYPGTSEPAGTAAAVQQALAADRVRKLAAANPEVSDRIAVGSPPSDPMQADGLSPVVRPASSGARQAASEPAPVSPPQEAPTAAPAALPQPLAPWQRYAANGHAKSAEEIHAALDQAVQAGHYTPDQAEALKAHTGVVDGQFLKALQGVLGTGKAGPERAQARAEVGLPIEGDLPPVRDPVRWESGERNYTRLADGLISDAQRGGHENLVTVLRQIKAEETTSGKAAIKADALKRLPEGEREAAERVLTGKLMQGRTDRPGAATPEPAKADPEPAKPAQPRLKAVALAQQRAKTTAALRAFADTKKGKP